MAPQSCNVFVVARFRPINSREKEISTTGVDEKGFKIQCSRRETTYCTRLSSDDAWPLQVW
jgi:hypothetical protein